MLRKFFHGTGVFLLAGLVLMGGVLVSKAAAADTQEFLKGSKVLVVYYSLSGSTREVAALIQKYTDADIYDVQTIKPYPQIPELYQYAKAELEQGDWPALNPDWPDFAQYDIIFVGGPVWWYTVNTPLISFLMQVDFKGKTVVPFCTHGGNTGDYFKRFAAEAKNANLLKGLDFYRPLSGSHAFLQSKVAAWLDGLSK